MKNLILGLFVSIFVVNTASAQPSHESDIDNLIIKHLDNVPSATGSGYPEVPKSEDYKSKGKSIIINGKSVKFKGRNTNLTDTVVLDAATDSGALTRSVSLKSSKNSAQMDSMETASGEMIKKVEEDRIYKSKKIESGSLVNRDKLVTLHDTIKQIKLSNLGLEQDPYVQGAFKCADLDESVCNKTENDAHDVKECDSGEMLQWTGSVWKCYGMFEEIKREPCKKDQFLKEIPGGLACVDYVYKWALTSWNKCDDNNVQKSQFDCYKLEAANSKKRTKVNSKHCAFLGERPSLESKCN